MAYFFDNGVTTAGNNLLADAIASGGVFTPTRYEVGDGNLAPGQSVKDMTGLISKKADFPINKKKRLPDKSQALIGGAFSNKEVTQGFYFRELGLFAKVVYPNNTESAEVLYCYGNAADEADYIPEYSTSAVVERQVDLIIYVGEDAQVNLEVASDIYVSSGEYQQEVAGIKDSINEIRSDVEKNTQDIIELDDAITDILTNKLFPIGYIYMSINNTNPGMLFGGTWEPWGTGRVPIGVDASQTEFNAVEKTGGSKTHTLTEQEMPQHSHTIRVGRGTTGSIVADYVSSVSSFDFDTDGAGGNQAHNNLQPYITCYMWKRVA